MLKKLFTSNARIKLLTAFLLNPDQEFFIRELTRKLDEQINSIRRELDNLKKMGLLRSRTKNRKKYYHVNKNFIFLQELTSIFTKATQNNDKLIQEIKNLGKITKVVLSGHFVENENSPVDMLVVGELDRSILDSFIKEKINPETPLKFTIMPESEFAYRLECKDKFITDILNDPANQLSS